MKTDFIDGALTFFPVGRIDSTNANQFETELQAELSLYDDVDIAFDLEKLSYISSAGLRTLLHLKKNIKKPVRIFNVSDELFDIFSVTGFNMIFEIERSMRQISLKGCKKVSSALNGEIFSLSDDEVIKVYGKNIPLSEIKKERDYSQTALIAGIPTLIPYDVVSCEHGYGIIYEKAGSESLAHALMRDTDHLETYAIMFANLMKELHLAEIPENELPDIKERYRGWISELDGEDDVRTKTFSTLIDSIPDRNNYVHGDINLNSIMLKDGELLLFDMAGSARGHSLFDLQSVFASLVGIEKIEPGYCRKNYGLSGAVCMRFWKAFFFEYMSGKSEEEIKKMNELLLKYFVLKKQVLDKIEMKNSLG